MGGSNAADCDGLGGWAVGARGGVYPADVDGGMAIRIRPGTKWIVMDTHFYNPALENARDSSGFKFDLSRTLRPNRVRLLW
eukprot:gene18872-15131_t